jgi:hypothetical protein
MARGTVRMELEDILERMAQPEEFRGLLGRVTMADCEVVARLVVESMAGVPLAMASEAKRLARERDQWKKRAEEAEAMYMAARAAESRLFAETNAEIERLAAEADRLRAERDARPEITAEMAAGFLVHYDDCDDEDDNGDAAYAHFLAVMAALRAQARKVTP